MIVGLGTFWIERNKAKAAKKIVPLYEQPINKLANLLIDDFSLNSNGYIEAYHVTAKRLKNASIKLVNDGARYSVYERERAVQALVLSEESISRAVEISKEGAKAIQSLKKANTELVKIIKDDSYSSGDIDEYAKQIQELINAVQIFSK